MSESSMYGIKKDFNGECIEEFGNSWLFSPIIWDVLLDKYMRSTIQTPYGYKKNMVTSGNELFRPLNKIINNCSDFSDRICWEMSHQQIFHVKDKEEIANAIRDFITSNCKYDKSDEDNLSQLQREHIIERFNEIASAIESIDLSEYEYFVFKNTSCDDNVEWWFSEYVESEGDYKKRAISEINELIAEFVVIKDKNIEFVSNLKFFNKDNKLNQ